MFDPCPQGGEGKERRGYSAIALMRLRCVKEVGIVLILDSPSSKDMKNCLEKDPLCKVDTREHFLVSGTHRWFKGAISSS